MPSKQREESTEMSDDHETEPGTSLAGPIRTPVPRRQPLARIGSFFLRVGSHGEKLDPNGVRKGLIEALREDPRVPIVYEPDPLADDEWTTTSIFPAATDHPDPNIVTGADQEDAYRFWSPITFEISVPRKNQPRLWASEPVASDRYLAVWDGWVLAVGWEHDLDGLIPSAGGQVVAQILAQAAEARGYSLYAQACMPSCERLFIHKDVRMVYDPAVTQVTLSPLDLFQLEAHLDATSASLRDLLEAFFWSCGYNVGLFAQAKNLARRILDLEDEGRGSMLALMRLQYERAHAREHHVWEQPRLLWGARGWRRQTKVAVTQQWVVMTAIEELRRNWADLQLAFEASVTEDAQMLLFERDARSDAEAVRSIDLSMIQRGAEEAAGRLDARSLNIATVGVAVSAVVGVVVGHFL